MVGQLIVNQGKVVRPSQLIASVRRLFAEEGPMGRVAASVGLVMMAGGVAALFISRQVLSARPVVIVLQASALALLVWARRAVGRRRLHAVAATTDGDLATSGPYMWIRHPMYASACLFSWACWLGHLSWLSLGMASLVTAGAVARMPAEEKQLRLHYPDYAAYARRTKRIVPYVF